MIYLVDTNVLLRFVQRSDPLNLTIRAAVRKLRTAGRLLYTTSQNLVEFWNGATRPIANNGFGMALPEANRHLRLVERVFRLLPDSQGVYPHWRQLVVTFSVSGSKVYDARLVAFMLVNGVTHILTLNVADFARYAALGIIAVDPRTV